MASQSSINIENINYNCARYFQKNKEKKSLEVFGLDTEADDTGRCFMIATSEGDVFKPEEFPKKLFSRKYRGKSLVAYNLKYDEGALVQNLPRKKLEELREKQKTTYGAYCYKIIPRKCLTVRRGKNSIHIYDMYNFYLGSLEYNAQKYLREHKIEMETKIFTVEYIRQNWEEIARYCQKDAILVRDLARLLIKKFEDFGVYPKKLYSTAYVSYQYFSNHTKYVTVKRFWNNDREVLQMALRSYAGGKFEVTEKGTGDFWEYDIVSAYPHEIARLVDITYARIVWEPKYRMFATYGFLHVKIKIPVDLSSPVAIMWDNINVYPSGEIERVITKSEYEYLVKYGADITIVKAVWLHCDRKSYPYKKEINRLVEYKHKYKQEGNELDYHTVKIFLNSLYGKMCQLIAVKKHWKASSCWNPIYASVITANVRCRITEFQQLYNSVIAVHTDSIISKAEIPLKIGEELGDMMFETSGPGMILGSGIYQVGEKSRFRGFRSHIPLMSLLNVDSGRYKITNKRPFTWREIVFHGWDTKLINAFTDVQKEIKVNFDRKRLWINDWKKFSDIRERNVLSLPLVFDRFS